MSERDDIIGDAILEARFDPKFMRYTRWLVAGWMAVTVVGIPLIPFWLLFSAWYCPEAHRRMSARLTARALEIRKGVFFRTEATIPLNRITDARLHDGPLMRLNGLRGVKVETAGQSGDSGSEGDLIGVIDAPAFRDAVLAQRQKDLDAEAPPPATSSALGGDALEILTQIRDILERMERRQ